MIYSDDRDKTMYYCLLTAFTIATIAVLLYMLFGSLYAAYMSLGVYAFSFSLLALSGIRQLFVIVNYKNRLDNFEKNPDLTEQQRKDFGEEKAKILSVVNSTWRKEMIKAILSGLFAIFTIVVLVLF